MQHSTQRWTLLGKVRVVGQAGTWKSESCSALTAGQHSVTDRCPPFLRLLIWEVVPTHVGLQQKAPRAMRQKLQFCAVHGVHPRAAHSSLQTKSLPGQSLHLSFQLIH